MSLQRQQLPKRLFPKTANFPKTNNFSKLPTSPPKNNNLFKFSTSQVTVKFPNLPTFQTCQRFKPANFPRNVPTFQNCQVRKTFNLQERPTPGLRTRTPAPKGAPQRNVQNLVDRACIGIECALWEHQGVKAALLERVCNLPCESMGI